MGIGWWFGIEISKHLMLLFNYTRAEKNDGPDRFQNISCYYLTI